MPTLKQRLHKLQQAKQLAGLAELTRGLEKESLRVTPTGTLAQTPHPQALGSALTHPHITTDFSEALLEFITAPSTHIDEVLGKLNDLHRLTYHNIGDELLWVNSMPCMLGEDSDIPVALYGHSNSGRMKTIYRKGLGLRYGRSMQAIAGVHFNFSIADTLWQHLRSEDKSPLSLQEYKTRGYFHLIRNFRRYFWLLLYLFGAAPAVCATFLRNKEHPLVSMEKDNHTLYQPYATSLRMGNLGYQSDKQNSLHISYNCLDSYTNTLCNAITHPVADYQGKGIKNSRGEYRQLNDSLLQIENEFYSVVRPKRTARSGQTALNALSEGGVEYIEVRCLDLDPFDPNGISAERIRFLDTFLLFCLLQDSPLSDERESQQLQHNQHQMVYRGRDPELELFHLGQQRKARDWGREIIGQLLPIADLLDRENGGQAYADALGTEARKLDDDRLTPSGRIIRSLEESGETFFRFAMNAANANRQHFEQQPLDREDQQAFAQMAKDSILQQRQIEDNDELSFEQFLKNYYNQYQCKDCDEASEKTAAIAVPDSAYSSYSA